jgi:hypothetical protein
MQTLRPQVAGVAIQLLLLLQLVLLSCSAPALVLEMGRVSYIISA